MDWLSDIQGCFVVGSIGCFVIGMFIFVNIQLCQIHRSELVLMP